MKCEFCGGKISLEDPFCRHCGRENLQARKHVSQMKQYEGEFRETQEQVYRVSRRYGEITARIIIVVVLLVVLITLLILQANIHHWQRAFGQRKAEKLYPEYSARIEEYLAKEDYLSLASFVDANYISGFDSKYECYQPIFRAVNAYTNLYSNINQVYAEGKDVEDKNLEYLGDTLDMFYSTLKLDSYTYVKNLDEEKCQAVFDAMEEYTRALLMTCFGLSREEAMELKDLSNSRRIIMIEEHIKNEKQ